MKPNRIKSERSRHPPKIFLWGLTSGPYRRGYLTFGQAGDALHVDMSAMPPLFSKDEKLKVYKEPKIGEYVWHMNEDFNTMKVIGIIGSDWYHVWFPATGEYGFVLQSDLTEGNG